MLGSLSQPHAVSQALPKAGGAAGEPVPGPQSRMGLRNETGGLPSTAESSLAALSYVSAPHSAPTSIQYGSWFMLNKHCLIIKSIFIEA